MPSVSFLTPFPSLSSIKTARLDAFSVVSTEPGPSFFMCLYSQVDPIEELLDHNELSKPISTLYAQSPRRYGGCGIYGWLTSQLLTEWTGIARRPVLTCYFLQG